MSIPKAYCVDCDDVIDIIQAKQLYIAQPKPRKVLRFLCPHVSCRELQPPAPVVGVNYMKTRGVDEFVQRPHYRITSGHQHSDDCPWVELSEAIDDFDRDPKNRRFATLRASELVDVFDPSVAVCDSANRIDSAAVSAIRFLRSKTARIEAYKAYLRENPYRTSRLHEAAHCFEVLTPEERENTQFRIGALPVRTYRKYFAAAKFCSPTAFYPRIYYGTANVRRWKAGFSVRFSDLAEQDDGTVCTVSVFVGNEILSAFRGRATILAILETAADLAENALTCYTYGKIERLVHNGITRIDIHVDSLHSLALTLNVDARNSIIK